MKMTGLAWFFLVLTLLPGLVGGVLCVNTRSYVRAASRAAGVVIGLDDDDDARFPIVRFQTVSGETVRFTSDQCNNWDGLAPGSKVTVLYLPDDPQADDWLLNYLWTLPSFFLGASVVFLLGFLRALWLGSQGSPEPSPPEVSLASLLRREE